MRLLVVGIALAGLLAVMDRLRRPHWRARLAARMDRADNRAFAESALPLTDDMDAPVVLGEGWPW